MNRRIYNRFASLLIALTIPVWWSCRTSDSDSSINGFTKITARSTNDMVIKLRDCAKQKKLAFPTLTPEAKASLDAVYDAFSLGVCGGCHQTGHSAGGIGSFSVTGLRSEEENRTEFFKGLAIRHFRTRDLAEACFVDGPAKEALMKALTKLRTGIEGGLRFFEKGSDEEMHDLARHFLQGGFEVPTEPGEPQHDALFDWFRIGDGDLPEESHITVLAEVIQLQGLNKPSERIPEPLQVITDTEEAQQSQSNH